MVAAAQAGGFNTLLVQVRGRGDAYYSGTIEPRAAELAGKPSFDPLATVLDRRARRRPEGARLGRGQSRLELGEPAGVARSRDLSRARMADGAARARGRDEEDRPAQPGVCRPAGALDARARVDRRRPLHLAAPSGRAGSHRRRDRRDRREVCRSTACISITCGSRTRTSITARRRWNSSRPAIAAGPDRSREARGRRARAARSGGVSESVSRALERFPPLAADVAGDQDSHRREDRAARTRSSAPRSCRTRSRRSPAACRTGAAGSISRCST